MTKFIFGLGNPGKKYGDTRHNIGFRVVDRLAERLGGKFKKQSSFLICEVAVKEAGGKKSTSIVLVKPQTFMNKSGEVVQKVLQDYAVVSEMLRKQPFDKKKDVLVVLDDIHLPLGVVRFRLRGSAGGHNGLASVLDTFKTLAIPRLRVGCGRLGEVGDDLARYVLANFEKEELDVLSKALERACDACMHWVSLGAEATMQAFNERTKSISSSEGLN